MPWKQVKRQCTKHNYYEEKYSRDIRASDKRMSRVDKNTSKRDYFTKRTRNRIPYFERNNIKAAVSGRRRAYVFKHRPSIFDLSRRRSPEDTSRLADRLENVRWMGREKKKKNPEIFHRLCKGKH